MPAVEKIGGNYFMRENPKDVYEKVFAEDPFETRRDLSGNDIVSSMFGDQVGGLNVAPRKKPCDIEVVLTCTLEEFYNGSIRQVEYTRNEIRHDAKTTYPVKAVQQVEIKPGCSEKSSLTFKGMGHDERGHETSNLVIKFEQAPHECYKRSNNDLVYTHKLSLLDSMQ